MPRRAQRLSSTVAEGMEWGDAVGVVWIVVVKLHLQKMVAFMNAKLTAPEGARRSRLERAECRSWGRSVGQGCPGVPRETASKRSG